MNRREFCKKSSLFLGAFPVAASFPIAAGSTIPAPSSPATSPQADSPVASAPVLQNPGGDGVTVVWAVNGSSTGWVEFGETEALGQKASGSVEGLMPIDDKVIKVRLQGLKPGAKYFYRTVTKPLVKHDPPLTTGNEVVAGQTYAFTTLDPAGSSTSFTLINDTHETRETVTRLLSLIQSQPSDSLIWDGDIFKSVSSETLIVDQVLNPFDLAYATSIPLILVKGNHDVRGAKARVLDKYCDVPGGRWYYLLRQGPIAFVVLDTGEDKPDSHPDYAGLNDFSHYRSVQREWLRDAIQEPGFRDAPFRVALLHIPILWKNYAQKGWYCPEAREKWHDLFVQAKLDLVISGHTHEHAWFPPGAQAPYAQLIGGGPHPDAATLIRAEADRKTLKITMCNLDGKELASHAFTSQV